jgi:Cu+-exporting ATPase
MHLLDAIAKGRTSEAIRKIMGLQAKVARVIRDNVEQEVPVEGFRLVTLFLLNLAKKFQLTEPLLKVIQQLTRKS